MAKSIKNGAKKPQSPSDSPELRKNVDELMQKYGGRSETELMSELKKVTDQQKRSGQFSEAELSAAENSILPCLNEEQQAKLRQILDAIR